MNHGIRSPPNRIGRRISQYRNPKASIKAYRSISTHNFPKSIKPASVIFRIEIREHCGFTPATPLNHEPLTHDINWGPHELGSHGGGDARGGVGHSHGGGLGEAELEEGGGDVAFGDLEGGHVERTCGDGSHEGGSEALVEAAEALVAENGAGDVEAGEA